MFRYRGCLVLLPGEAYVILREMDMVRRNVVGGSRTDWALVVVQDLRAMLICYSMPLSEIHVNEDLSDV